MICPKCNVALETLRIKSVTVYYCKTCKAMWVSFPMLKKLGAMLDLKTELLNPVEMESINVKEAPRACPECTKSMDKVYFNGILVDKCSECNGVWFDNGELSKYFAFFMKNPAKLTDNVTFIKEICSMEPKNEPEFHELEIQSKEVEKPVLSVNGFFVAFCLLAVIAVSLLLVMVSPLFAALIPILVIVSVLVCAGFKILKPQEAFVLTLFGKYLGTLRGAGFHWVNPLAVSVTPFTPISLKAMTLENGKQKINDQMGNPIEVGIIVIWEVQDTAKAIFNVENYKSFISAQSDSALRNIVRMYPYDAPEASGVQSLRGDSAEISAKLKSEIQRNVRVAGIRVVDAKITHLAYAPEIAVAMLQRQQAAAVIDAKKAIVDGAVGMVEMALNRLSSNNVVQLDEIEKAKMVNNLLVILCSNKEAQPVIGNRH